MVVLAVWRQATGPIRTRPAGDAACHALLELCVGIQRPVGSRYRLIGTGLTEALGYDATGMDLRDVYSGFRVHGELLSLRKQVAETRQPIWRLGTSTVKFRLDFVPIEQVYLPLAEDGETVDTIWGVLNYKMGGDQDAS